MNDFEEKTQIITLSDRRINLTKEHQQANACLMQYSGEHIGQRYILNLNEIKLGRSPTCQIIIADTSVSRHHAIIFLQGNEVYLQDLSSVNGTFINEKKISSNNKHKLNNQDLIKFGKIIFKFFDQNNIDGFVQDKIYKMAILDSGTQIFNKKYLLDALEAQFNFSQNSKSELSIIYFDLDHFKKVNDTYGHNAGDQLLRSVVDLVKHMIRKEDIFGRFGGEEFVIILPQTSKTKTVELAERIRKCIEENIFSLDYEKNKQNSMIAYRQTISLGVEAFDEKQTSASSLLEAADRKLYISKQTGRNKLTA